MYREKILKLAKDNSGIIRTKILDEHKIPRIYLTYLVKEKKLFKLSRGVYSITKDKKTNMLYEIQEKSKNVIYSNFTSLKLLKFYKSDLNDKIQITVPQGYNANNFSDYEVFYDSSSNFNDGITMVEIENGQKIKTYCLERTICDLIKNKNRFDHNEVNRVLHHYFMSDYLNYKKLLYFSKKLNVSKKVSDLLAIFKV